MNPFEPGAKRTPFTDTAKPWEKPGKIAAESCSCISAKGHSSGCTCGCFDDHVCVGKEKQPESVTFTWAAAETIGCMTVATVECHG